MTSEPKELTKRVRNRLLLCVALVISCGMGFLILLDSRHLGFEIQYSKGTYINLVEQPIEQLESGGRCIVYSSYGDISVKSTETPRIDNYEKPTVYVYDMPSLALNFSHTINLTANDYYDIRLAQLIPDVNQDGFEDIFISAANTSKDFLVEPQGDDYVGLVPVYTAYYNLILSGKDGSIFGDSLPGASFCSRPFDKVIWTDYNFTTADKINSRDSLPDLVGLFNISDTYYVEGYHVDVKDFSLEPHLAWSINGTVANTTGGNQIQDGQYHNLVFINSTDPDDVIILVKQEGGFMRVFAYNGSYGITPQVVIELSSASFDFTGDGTEEVFCVNQTMTSTKLALNLSLFDVVKNESLPTSHVVEKDLAQPIWTGEWGIRSHPNGTQPVGGFRTLYLWCSAFPEGSSSSQDRFSYLWQVLFETTGIRQGSALTLHGDNVIGDVLPVKFNSDSQFDIGLYIKGKDNLFIEFAVFNGVDFTDKLESYTGFSSYGSINTIRFIPDFAKNGEPDALLVMGDRLYTISFETILYFQQDLIFTVLLVLCIIGFAFAIIYISKWRRSLRRTGLHEGEIPESIETLKKPPEIVQQDNKYAKARRSPLLRLLWGLIIALVILTIVMVGSLRIQNSGLPMHSLEVQMVHLITLIFLVFYSMIPIVAVLFNVGAPIFATSIFLKTQAAFYKMQPGKYDYRVLVLDYGNRKGRSAISHISRSVFPTLLAIAVGIYIFNAFNEAGQLSGFSGGVQMQQWIASFEILCALPIILTFMASSFIVPSSWLLDDAGVVYFIENIQYRELGDVSKVSEWLLQYVKAIAGFTALFQYVSLFFNTNLLITMDDNPIMGVIMTLAVFVFIVLFPFLGGFVYMLVAQITVENNLPSLTQKLYKRMNAMGIDTTPRQLRDVLDPNDSSPREFKKVGKKVKMSRKEDMMSPPLQ